MQSDYFSAVPLGFLLKAAFGACLIFSSHIKSPAAIVCPSGPTLSGVDVSQLNGVVDWTNVAGDGVLFAFARVSNGTNVDTSFESNYAGIKTAGMVRGAYQFFRPSQDPIAQASVCLSNIGNLEPGDLPPALDVEVTDGRSAADIVARIQSWVSTIQSAIGRAPIIFCSAAFWNSSVGNSMFSSDPLWVAHWNVACPNLPNAWSGWKFWQSSSTGHRNGISGTVDLDQFNGTQSELLAMTGPSSFNNPLLSISPGAGTVTISWTPATPGFVLQQNDSIDTLNWTNAPSGGINPVTVSSGAQRGFFRLFKP